VIAYISTSIGQSFSNQVFYWTFLHNMGQWTSQKSYLYRVFQKDLNIFYSGHRGHWTWHPVIFSYGGTLKTMPTNHKL
jgi:hypothetical protein